MPSPLLRLLILGAVAAIPCAIAAQETERDEEHREPAESFRRDQGPPPEHGDAPPPARRGSQVDRPRPAREAQPRVEGQARREGPRPGAREPGFGPEAEQMHRRLHHLNVAIEHLRLGGFHEPAEHLQRESNRIREQMHGVVEHREERIIRRGPPMEGGGEIDQLRAEVRELRQALNEIRERLERDSRGPRRPPGEE